MSTPLISPDSGYHHFSNGFDLQAQNLLEIDPLLNQAKYGISDDEKIKQLERQIIKSILQAQNGSMQNETLGLYNLLNSTGGLQSMCKSEDERRRFLEDKKEPDHSTHGDTKHHTEGHKAHAHDTSKLDVVLFLFLCLMVGNFFKPLASKIGVPYTSLITILGLILGVFSKKLGRTGVAIEIWSQMNPHLLLLLFIPALIFESAFNSDWHIFKVEMGQVLLMAGPMLLVSTILSALMMRYILGYKGEFTFQASLMFGSIISATDPVAVVVLLKELGASRRLATMIEGESLLNDGTAMVVFLVLIDIVKGVQLSALDIIIKFVRLSIGGPLLGVIGGIVMQEILKRIHNNFVLEVNTTIFGSYLIFFIAEQTPVHVSGILAIVCLGLYMTRSGKTRISAESEHAVHHVWGYIGFVAETLIFVLTGIIIGQRAVSETKLGGSDVLKLVFGTYPILHLIRFSINLLFWPILARCGYGLTFNQLVLATYAGLRGAVGMSLALMVSVDDEIPKYIQDVVLLHVGGIALMTLLINATTTKHLVLYLGLSKQSDLQKNILFGVTHQIDKNIDENIQKLQHKKHFNLVDWDKIKKSTGMNEVKERLKKYRNIHLDDEQAKIDYTVNNLEGLQRINEHIKKVEDQSAMASMSYQQQKLSHIQNLNQLGNPNDTFKGKKKNKAYDHVTPGFNAVNVPDNASIDDNGNQYQNDIPLYEQGKTNLDELISELRHKYLTILKQNYWEFFEEGQCTSESVILLVESADKCMDDETQPMKDWDYLKSYLLSDSFLQLLSGISQIPVIGGIFRTYLFSNYLLSYDAIVNFIEAHETTDKMLQAVIENKEFVNKILTESHYNVDESDTYLNSSLHELFPEISKAIQQRRAEYYVLVHQYHEVESMLKNGQIEDKEANELKQEIDKKVYFLSVNEPEIVLQGQTQRIIHDSELSTIFDKEQLEQAVEQMKDFKEEIYQQKEQIITQGQIYDKILYVARGTVVEKHGEYQDPEIGSLKFTKGRIACLQNLLPKTEDEPMVSDLYCHHSSIASVAPLDLNFLKYILEKDEDKLIKLWEVLSVRIIILNPYKLKQFLSLTQQRIKMFTKMCEIKIYRPGDPVDIDSGAIIFRGGLSKSNADIKLFHQTLYDNQNLDIDDDFALKQDADDFRNNSSRTFAQQQKSSHKTKNNQSQNASKKFLQQKKTLANLGTMMKTIGKQNLEDSELDAVMFIAPQELQKGFVARSKDYVVIMHFNDILQDKIITGQAIDSKMVESAFASFQKRRSSQIRFQGIDLNGLENLNTYTQQQSQNKTTQNLLAIDMQDRSYQRLSQNAKNQIEQNLGKLNNTNTIQTVIPNRNKEFNLHLEYSGQKVNKKTNEQNGSSLNTTDIELQGGDQSMMRIHRNGLSNGFGNGYSSKLRIPGIYQTNEESSHSQGSFQIKNSPDRNRQKPYTHHHSQDSDEPVNEEGDVIVKHVDI